MSGLAQRLREDAQYSEEIVRDGLQLNQKDFFKYLMAVANLEREAAEHIDQLTKDLAEAKRQKA